MRGQVYTLVYMWRSEDSCWGVHFPLWLKKNGLWESDSSSSFHSKHSAEMSNILQFNKHWEVLNFKLSVTTKILQSTSKLKTAWIKISQAFPFKNNAYEIIYIHIMNTYIYMCLKYTTTHTQGQVYNIHIYNIQYIYIRYPCICIYF